MAKAKPGLRVKRAAKTAIAPEKSKPRAPGAASAATSPAGPASVPAVRATVATMAAGQGAALPARSAALRAAAAGLVGRGSDLFTEARQRGALATAGGALAVMALMAGIVGWRMGHDGPQAQAAIAEIAAPASAVAAVPTAAPVKVAAVAAAKPQVLDGYVLLDVYRGRALLEGGGDLHEVKPGTRLRGAGTIEEIRRQDGRWIVVASKGLITAR